MHAARALERVPQDDRMRLAARVDSLALDSRPVGSRRLRHQRELYRVREGDYRIVYAVEDDRLLVLVMLIGQRGDVYRRLKRLLD